MPAWIYVLATCAVGLVLFVVVFHPFRRGAHAAPRALPVRVDAGSMVLAEERTVQFPPQMLTAPLAAPWQPLGLNVDLRGVGGVTAPLAQLGGQLGPRARAVLAAYDARCVERWGHAIYQQKGTNNEVRVR